ncbi:MAG: hypothetical protein U0165_07745 [Polyangiaceae bacterium]
MWLARGNIDRASKTVTTGQGQGLLDSILNDLEEPVGPWSAAEVERALSTRAAQGLRYVALFAPDGDLLVEAGTPVGAGFPMNGMRHYAGRRAFAS